MKLILLKDVPGVGRRFDVKEVKDGYARNFLLPRQLAKIATESAVKQLVQQKAGWEKEKQERVKALAEIASKMSGLTLEFKLKGGEKGEAFGSITKSEIKKSLEEKGFSGLEVALAQPLKKEGRHQIDVGLGEGIKAKISVSIVIER